ncbi:MAG: polyprenyl synthetase family protein [Actinomycetota bacterium]
MYPDFLVKEFNSYLDEVLATYNKVPGVLREAIFYCIKNGGKRLRPVLCMLSAISLKKDYRVVMPTACAIEFIHTYSLIHDDLPAIDNDDLRRGKPSCHKAFGEDMAILTGDALFAESFHLITRKQIAPAKIKLEVIGEIASASGAMGMVAGQFIDVYYSGKKISRDKLNYMHRNKTGKLITASVKCGAMLSGANQQQIDGLCSFATNIGLVFQITDDILDITSNSKCLGKSTGKDAAQDKNTFPKIWGMEESKKIARLKVKEAKDTIQGLGLDTKPLEEIANFILSRKT